MTSSLLATKLHWPSLPPKRVQRPQLIQRLNEGLESGRQLTLVSAPAGFGKTTCISEWVNGLALMALEHGQLHLAFEIASPTAPKRLKQPANKIFCNPKITSFLRRRSHFYVVCAALFLGRVE